MLDSLVRVSRRDDKRHFVRVPRASDGDPKPDRYRASSAHPRKLDLQKTTDTTHKWAIQRSNLPTLPPIGSISAISGTI
jgi:hypothetical protein